MDGERDTLVRDIARRIVKDLTGVDIEIEPEPELELDDKIAVAQPCVALKLTLQEVGMLLEDPTGSTQAEDFIAKAIGYAESGIEAATEAGCEEECDEMRLELDQANEAADAGNWILAKDRLWSIASQLRELVRGEDYAVAKDASVPSRW